jgi:hypothetical protein
MLTAEELRDNALYVLLKYCQDQGYNPDFSTFLTLLDWSISPEGELDIQRWDVPNVAQPSTSSLKSSYTLEAIANIQHLWKDYLSLRSSPRVLVTTDKAILEAYAPLGTLIYDEEALKLFIKASQGWQPL